MVALFAAIPSAEANSMYLSCVSDVLKYADSSQHRKDPVLGSWSRLVLLGNRITDKDNYQDVNEDMRRAVVSSMTGTLCSPACLKEPRAIATVFCLARRALLPQSSNEKASMFSSLERYECWLRDLVLNSGAAITSVLLDTLSQLVPLEPIHFLKSHHQIFSKNRGLFHQASGYLAQLRSRIRDFDPTFSNVAAENHSNMDVESDPTSKISAKVMTEIAHFVFSYKEKKELPKLLIRQMNFHRYHFRRAILPLLLHPDFTELKPTDGDLPRILDSASFDELRIDMIREIAFRRKDHAITAPEAKSAIESIKAAKSARCGRSVSNSKIQGKSVFASSSVKGTSSVRDIVFAILCDEIKHGLEEMVDRRQSNQIEKAKELLCFNVSNCIEKCNGSGDLASVAIDVLEGFCFALEDVGRREVSKAGHIFGSMRPPNVSENSRFMEECKSWWKRIGLPFLSLLSNVLGDSRLITLQAHIRYQIIALLCARISSVSEESLFSLSLIIVALVILRSKTALHDLCFLGNSIAPKNYHHIGLIIFECLPLSKPEFVFPSITFTLHFLYLLKTFPEDVLLTLNIESDISMDATLACTGHEYIITEFSAFPKAILRWIVSNPWRLTRKEGQVIAMEGEQMSQETSGICRRAIACLHDITFFVNGAEPLATTLNLEHRASWGCRFALAAQMRVMNSLGLHGMVIVNNVVKFLAVAKKSQRNSLEWIHQGLLLFYEGSTDCIPTSIDDNVTTNIKKCVREAGTDVANNMIEYYRSMEFPYFKGCDDAYEHIAQVLILKMWPFSRQVAAYLLRCVTSSDVIIAGRVDPFFVANCTLVFDAHRDARFHHLADPSVDSDQNILKTVKDVAQESNIVLQHCYGGDFEYQGTNGNVLQSQINSCNISTLSLLDAQSLGIALSMRLVKESQNRTATPEVIQQLVSTIVARAGKPAACDVLDGAIISIALLHCKELYRTSYSTKSEGHSLNSLLSSFVQERVCLFEGEGDRLPFWIKCSLLDGFGFESEAGRNLLKEWFDSAHESETNIEAQECIARILGSLEATRKGVVERVIQTLGRDRTIDTLLPNLGWGFVHTVKIRGRSKTAIRRQLVSTIGRVTNYLQPEVGGDFVAAAMNRFGTDSIEILTLLKARGFR